MVCVKGKSKMNIPCPALSFFSAVMSFCKVGGCKIMEVKYGQIFHLVLGGLALFQPVNWCSFRLIL